MKNNALAIPVPPPPVTGTNTGDAVSEANLTMASALNKKLKEIGESFDEATQCMFGRACSSEDDKKENQPNSGKDLTDEGKAELGGTGSGTPEGWGPEDEEIANGHAFDKHVIEQSEFKELGISTKEQFAAHIEKVVKNPTSSKSFSGGRIAYWDETSGTVVICNPKSADGGTAFRPTNGRAYYDNLR